MHMIKITTFSHLNFTLLTLKMEITAVRTHWVLIIVGIINRITAALSMRQSPNNNNCIRQNPRPRELFLRKEIIRNARHSHK